MNHPAICRVSAEESQQISELFFNDWAPTERVHPEARAASTMADAEIEGPSQTLICQLLVESKPLEALMDIIANGCDSDSPTLQEATYSTAQVRNLVNAVREELETYYQNEV